MIGRLPFELTGRLCDLETVLVEWVATRHVRDGPSDLGRNGGTEKEDSGLEASKDDVDEAGEKTCAGVVLG